MINDDKKEESSKDKIKSDIFYSDKKFFNIDEIIKKCKDKDGIELLNYICSIMQERKRNVLEMLYKELGKDYLIMILEKTLNIENSGGLLKEINSEKEKKEQKINVNYVQYGLREFSADDGVPITLKAMLFNRYHSSNGFYPNIAEMFKAWYERFYLGVEGE